MRPERREKGVTKAKRVLKIWDATFHWGRGGRTCMQDFDEGNSYVKTIVHTRKRCSCSMCGNPRKFGETTMQEKKADISFKEQLDNAA